MDAIDIRAVASERYKTGEGHSGSANIGGRKIAAALHGSAEDVLRKFLEIGILLCFQSEKVFTVSDEMCCIPCRRSWKTRSYSERMKRSCSSMALATMPRTSSIVNKRSDAGIGEGGCATTGAAEGGNSGATPSCCGGDSCDFLRLGARFSTSAKQPLVMVYRRVSSGKASTRSDSAIGSHKGGVRPQHNRGLRRRRIVKGTRALYR
jgi:hypothetical protein